MSGSGKTDIFRRCRARGSDPEVGHVAVIANAAIRRLARFAGMVETKTTHGMGRCDRCQQTHRTTNSSVYSKLQKEAEKRKIVPRSPLMSRKRCCCQT